MQFSYRRPRPCQAAPKFPMLRMGSAARNAFRGLSFRCFAPSLPHFPHSALDGITCAGGGGTHEDWRHAELLSAVMGLV